MLAMFSSANKEPRISIRLVWPFVRLAGGNREEMALLEREGVGLAEFANSDTRVRHSLAMALLEHAIARSGDLALGLHAAQQLEAGDLDVFEYAARSCATLREAFECQTRYLQLLNEAAELTLIEEGSLAILRQRFVPGVAWLPAAADFGIASAFLFQQRYATGADGLLEVHFTHAEPSYRDAYDRLFGVPVRFGMPDNALVMQRSRLDLPMAQADRGVHVAFELQAEAWAQRVRGQGAVAARVRELALEQIPDGDPSMEATARKLAMSVATLRRRLDGEGTSHRAILDEVRRELAERYLSDRELAISEVAFRLGFAHVTALHKAFKRWTGGLTPGSFRARRLGHARNEQGLNGQATLSDP